MWEKYTHARHSRVTQLERSAKNETLSSRRVSCESCARECILPAFAEMRNYSQSTPGSPVTSFLVLPRVVFIPVVMNKFIFFQTVRDFLGEYESKVPQLQDDHRGYAYDAVWAMALALNKTISSLTPGTEIANITYGDTSLADALTKSLGETNFSGVTVCVSNTFLD